MLSVYTRHLSDCSQKDIHYRRCRCPKWIQGTVAGQPFLRKTAGTASWEHAEQIARKWENETINPSQKRVSIESTFQTFVEHKQGQRVSPDWLNKLLRLCTRLQQYASAKGLLYLDQLTTAELTTWRNSWQGSPLTAAKTQERMRQLFKYCVDCGWLEKNPVKAMGRIQVRQRPTLPFTSAQYEALLAVTHDTAQWPCNPYQRVRLRALVELMRYSGLRITDAVTLERGRLIEGKLFLYTQKTGVPVYCPLPPHVVEQLEAVKNAHHPGYFFWSGVGEKTRACNRWESSLKLLFERANLGMRGHAHMLRDTFAVELLLAGVPIDQVSILLGHSSVKITEKYYAPFVKARQEQIAANVMKTWPQPKLHLVKKTGA